MIGKSVAHDSSITHVTGESVFIDDIIPAKDEIQVSYFGSPVAAGKLKKIHTDKALKIAGVLAIYTAKDIKHNLWGTIIKDQPILVENEIGYMDEPLCIIVAETKEALALARKTITVDISNKKPVLSIQEAINKKAFLYTAVPFKKGKADEAYEKAPHKLSGEFFIGGQEHFYLESQASLVYPMEQGQIKVLSSTQHPTETQHVCAHALGLKYHQVVCECKRMGGGFGGKESQAAPFAAMAALAAYKLKRPARIALSKDDDMTVTGKRHPFKNFYQVGFDNEGRILSLKAKLYADGGAYTDLSPSILDRALFHIDGAYYLENAYLEGFVCKTNTHSNTAFRGFGGPQGNMTIEKIIEEIALTLKKDPLEIRRLNCYGKNDRNLTPYGQTVTNNLLSELFDQLYKSSDYQKRRKEIDAFNASAKGQIKGLSMTACKFGISFTATFLNQGNALVNIHRDGTVQVSTGATEMGQGVNTKIRQVVAHAFAIPIEDVFVMTTSTEKNANTSPTAASSGSDINGAAALLACEKILERLNPLREKNQSWKELVVKAYLERISLCDYAHFKTEGIGFDKKTSQGTAFKYYTSGVALSEVLIDTYTGDLKVLRSDLLMDLGRPMNPGIDMGQVTGGFIQGVGWVTTENLYYNSHGALISHSPTTYKIPNIQDIPRIMNVKLLENDLNSENLHRSKAVGEPPLLLGASVIMAVQNALSYRSHGKLPQIKSPATPEMILMELSSYGI